MYEYIHYDGTNSAHRHITQTDEWRRFVHPTKARHTTRWTDAYLKDWDETFGAFLELRGCIARVEIEP